jgi:hypothetical protein
MDEDSDKPRSEADAQREREIRQGRRFNPTEAIARAAGPGAMKGASPVSPVRQAEMEVGSWLSSHVPDAVGAMQFVLNRQFKGHALLLNSLDCPLAGLADFCRQVLNSDELLKELVRQADVEWGQRMDDRPYFETDSSAHNPSDPHTVESVRNLLSELVAQLADPGQS